METSAMITIARKADIRAAAVKITVSAMETSEIARTDTTTMEIGTTEVVAEVAEALETAANAVNQNSIS